MRNVIVTGAAGGIGFEIVKRFLSEGDRVLAVGHQNRGALSALSESYPETLCICFADLSGMDGVAAVASEAESFLGTVDVLVNNAGIAYDALFQDVPDDVYERILHTNLSSAIRLTKALLPGMIRHQSGRIINVSSIFGSVGASMEVEYSATKGAIEAFTRSLAKETAPSGITVNAVAPGLIDTPMNASYTDEEIEALLGSIPVGRMGKPSEVADLVYYLSVAPAYLTGQVIRIDGGWM